MHRAKNQRLVLSDDTICAIGNELEMPELMDHIVAVRVEKLGPYSLAELNPPVGTHSVCEVVTPGTVRRLLASAGGRFTSDEAHRFCDYHLTDADDELMVQVVRMSDLSRWDIEAILNDLGYTGDIEALLFRGKKPQVADGHHSASSGPFVRETRTPRLVLEILGSIAAVAGVVFGGVLIGSIVLVVFALALVAGTSEKRTMSDRYLNVRSDYHRRVWSDDHDFEADGDSDHNWEADGDKPW